MELRVPAVVALGGEIGDAGLGLGEFFVVILDFVEDGCVRSEASHR